MCLSVVLCLPDPADEKDAIARLAKVASSVTQAVDVEPAARARAEIEASLKAPESKVRNLLWGTAGRTMTC